MAQYVKSVGRNGNYLLNIAPNNLGTIDQIDMERYVEFGVTLNYYGQQYAIVSGNGSGSRLDISTGSGIWIDHLIYMENQAKGENVQVYVVLGNVFNSNTFFNLKYFFFIRIFFVNFFAT
jgi:hypothetical protein